MREPAPFHDTGNSGDAEAWPAPAEAATEIGAAEDDMSLPVWEVIRTALLAIVIVATTALIATLAQ